MLFGNLADAYRWDALDWDGYAWNFFYWNGNDWNAYRAALDSALAAQSNWLDEAGDAYEAVVADELAVRLVSEARADRDERVTVAAAGAALAVTRAAQQRAYRVTEATAYAVGGDQGGFGPRILDPGSRADGKRLDRLGVVHRHALGGVGCRRDRRVCRVGRHDRSEQRSFRRD